MRKLAAMLCFLACTPCHAEEPPDRLRCRLIVANSCAPNDGLCAGAAVRSSPVRLSVDARKRLLVLNGVEGQVPGEEPLVPSEHMKVKWQYSLIGLDQFRVWRREEGEWVLELSAHLAGGSYSQLEFTCRG